MSDHRNPWLKFYPSDWRADARVRACSLAARGLWIEMLCLMHEADECGDLAVGCRPIATSQLASLVGMSTKQVGNLLQELELNGVFSRDETGLIFSRRMRRDVAKAKQNQDNGSRGGNPSLKPGVNPQVKAQKPEARSQKESSSVPSEPPAECRPQVSAEQVERLWKTLPKRQDREAMARKFRSIVAAGKATSDEVLAGAARAAAHHGTDDPKYFRAPVVWLNQSGWKDDYGPPRANAPIPFRKNNALAIFRETFDEPDRQVLSESGQPTSGDDGLAAFDGPTLDLGPEARQRDELVTSMVGSLDQLRARHPR